MSARDPDRLRALKKAHATSPSGPTPRVEDYIEVVYELILEKGYARIIDIGGHLHVSSPTATKMVQKMADDGLVVYERYRGIALTDAGTELAKRLRERHGILTSFLRFLVVADSTAHQAPEAIVAHMAAATHAPPADTGWDPQTHPRLSAPQPNKELLHV